MRGGVLIYKQGYGLKPLMSAGRISSIEDDTNMFLEPQKRAEETVKGCVIRDMKCKDGMKAHREK